jgi:hypothetical protein
LTLGGFSLKGDRKFTLTNKLELETIAGQAKVGYVLIPFTREVREWTPTDGGEKFPREFYIPIRDMPWGSLATMADLHELLDLAVGAPTPVGGGDASFSDTRCERTEVSWSVGLDLGDKVNKFGLTASLAGSVAVTIEFSLPPGSFQLSWLRGPAGAVIRDAGGL